MNLSSRSSKQSLTRPGEKKKKKRKKKEVTGLPQLNHLFSCASRGFSKARVESPLCPSKWTEKGEGEKRNNKF